MRVLLFVLFTTICYGQNKIFHGQIIPLPTDSVSIMLRGEVDDENFSGLVTVMRLGTMQFIDGSSIEHGNFKVKLPIGKFKIYLANDKDNNFVIVEITKEMKSAIRMRFPLKQHYGNVM